jgi:hypothetical protein
MFNDHIADTEVLVERLSSFGVIYRGDLQRQVRAPLALAAGPKARHLATRVCSTFDVVRVIGSTWGASLTAAIHGRQR